MQKLIKIYNNNNKILKIIEVAVKDNNTNNNFFESQAK